MTPASHAQWAVVDVGAITQLIQEVNYWKQQIQAMSSQLNQLQSTYNAMTGNRGMQNLLPVSPQQRNYLPTNWQGLMATLNGLSGSYGVLSAQLNSTLSTNAVLTPAQLARLSPQEQAQLQSSRNSAALMQATSQQAFQASSTFRHAAATDQRHSHAPPIRRARSICRRGSPPSRACCRTSRPRCRCSIRRCKREERARRATRSGTEHLECRLVAHACRPLGCN